MEEYVSKDLDQWFQSKKKPSILLGQVERHLMMLPPDKRRTDVLHPSEMCKRDWCIRESWFLLNGHPKPKETHSLRLQSIFAEGHAIHDKWQNWLAGMDALRGVWKCPDHGSWWGKRSDACEVCDVSYEEVPIVHEQYRIAGHADGWIVGVAEDEYLLEIKSIGTGTIRTGGGKLSAKGLADAFKKISSPFTDHVRQATIYLWVLKQTMGSAAPDKILFLYECKEDQNAREFSVDYDEEWIGFVLDKLALLDPDSDEPPACTGGEGPSCAKCRRYAQ